uniref:Major facilitator superfamily (MFS) profile domain-containing protein n=1 Tax=Oryza barthii TaxID=65489 RepID=A0A0D3GSU4_9ORYZ
MPESTKLTAMAVDPKKKNASYAFTCAILASMASIILGYDIGVMSGASLYIKKDLKITDVQVEILMGILNIYSLVGSFAAGRTADWIGRRFTVVFAAAFFFAGALLMGFSGDYATLMVGRFVAGVGVGYAIMIAPVYTAEISPASSRGFLTSFPEVSINLGILLGYVSNYAFARLPLSLGWRVMLGVGAAPSVLLALMVLGMPESPRWLVMKGRLADAKAVLEKIADTPEEASERLADIKAAAGIPDDLDGDVVTVSKKRGGEEGQVWRELVVSPTPAMRRIVLAAVGLHFFQQASGVDSVVLSARACSRARAIFPLRARALGFAVAVACNRVTSGVISMTFLSLSSAITIGGSFFLYAAISSLAWVFFFTRLPETRGQTLEEIGKVFGMDDTAMEAEDSAAYRERLLATSP